MGHPTTVVALAAVLAYRTESRMLKSDTEAQWLVTGAVGGLSHSELQFVAPDTVTMSRSEWPASGVAAVLVRLPDRLVSVYRR